MIESLVEWGRLEQLLFLWWDGRVGVLIGRHDRFGPPLFTRSDFGSDMSPPSSFYFSFRLLGVEIVDFAPSTPSAYLRGSGRNFIYRLGPFRARLRWTACK